MEEWSFRAEPRAPFQFTPHLERFSLPGKHLPHLYVPEERAFEAAVRAGNSLAGVRAVIVGEPWRPRIRVSVYAPSRAAAGEAFETVMNMVRAGFDYNKFLEETARIDKRLYRLASKYPGLRPGRCTSLYAALIDSVVKQRITLRAALRTYSRLVEALGCRLQAGPRTFYWHPCPHTLAQQTAESLRRLGLTRMKAQALIEIARAEEEGRLPRPEEAARDPWTAAQELTKLYGVGPWTAQLAIAMISPVFPLGPLSDLAVTRGLRIVAGCTDCQALARKITREAPVYAGLILYLAAYEYEEHKRGAHSAR